MLYDTVYTVTGSKMEIPGVPEGTRAAALADAATNLPDGFLANLGRPARESACECERSADLQLGPVMALMNGPTIATAISQPGNGIEELIKSQPDDAAAINELFLRILNRPGPAGRGRRRRSRPASGWTNSIRRCVAELEQYRVTIAPVIAEQEAKREAAISAAQAELDRYKAEIAPAEAEKDRLQQEKIAGLQADLTTYDAAVAAGRPRCVGGRVQTDEHLDHARSAEAVSSMAGVTLAKQPDLSILASGESEGRVEHTVVATTNLKRITGIKLEALAEGSYTSLGPGLAANANFVLTELPADWSPPDEGASWRAFMFCRCQRDVLAGELQR